MFRRSVSNENSVVGDIPETSAAFDEKDVPIYVIESNVRNKLREDMERARIEEKRLINLEDGMSTIQDMLKKLLEQQENGKKEDNHKRVCFEVKLNLVPRLTNFSLKQRNEHEFKSR